MDGGGFVFFLVYFSMCIVFLFKRIGILKFRHFCHGVSF